MSLISNITEEWWLIGGGIVLVLILIIGALIIFFEKGGKYKKGTVLTVLILVLMIAIIITAILIFYPAPPNTLTQIPVNLSVPDPNLYMVVVTMPDGSNKTIYTGQSVDGNVVEIGQNIKAKGYRIDSSGTKITYNLDYTFSDITAINVYYTCGGPQNSLTYMPDVTLYNQSGSPLSLFTEDMYANIYFYEVMSVGTTPLPTYLNQAFFTDSSGTEGIIITTIDINEITADSNGILSVTSSIPSTTLTFKNGTSASGYLSYMNVWEEGAAWVTLTSIAINKSITTKVWLGQWWRIIEENGTALSSVYIIASSDISSSNEVNLS